MCVYLQRSFQLPLGTFGFLVWTDPVPVEGHDHDGNRLTHARIFPSCKGPRHVGKDLCDTCYRPGYIYQHPEHRNYVIYLYWVNIVAMWNSGRFKLKSLMVSLYRGVLPTRLWLIHQLFLQQWVIIAWAKLPIKDWPLENWVLNSPIFKRWLYSQMPSYANFQNQE